MMAVSATTCRICLNGDAIYPIFESNEEFESVYKKLPVCLREKIEDKDGYPRYICLNCKTTSESISDFIAKFEKTCEVLKGIILQVKNEPQDDFTVNLTEYESEPDPFPYELLVDSKPQNDFTVNPTEYKSEQDPFPYELPLDKTLIKPKIEKKDSVEILESLSHLNVKIIKTNSSDIQETICNENDFKRKRGLPAEADSKRIKKNTAIAVLNCGELKTETKCTKSIGKPVKNAVSKSALRKKAISVSANDRGSKRGEDSSKQATNGNDNIEIETTEKKRIRNREYQRAWRQRKKDLKKKVSKEEKEERKRKRHRENQRAYYYRQKSLLENDKNLEELCQKKLDELQMKSKKLDSNEDQESVVDSQNLENVELEQNQLLTRQHRLYEVSRECITPKVILHRNTDIPDDGNCLFQSLIRVLQLPLSTCDLRRQLCNSPYLKSCHDSQKAYNILSSNNEYGDLDCLYLFAKNFNQNICVHNHYFNAISTKEGTLFCHFQSNDTHNWIHLDLREQHFTPYISDDEKREEDERKQKQKNKEYSKRYRDKKRKSNVQTGSSASNVLDVQPVFHTSQIAGPSTGGVLFVPPVILW